MSFSIAKKGETINYDVDDLVTTLRESRKHPE